MEFELQRPETGKWASAVFSLLMHAGLVLVLYYGVQWQRREPAPISVELVASLPPMDAPRPVEAPPPPLKPVEIKPVEIKPAPLAKPDIALKEPEKKKPVKKEEPKPLPPPPKPEVKPEKKPEVKPVPDKKPEPKLSDMERLLNKESDKIAAVNTQNRLNKESTDLRAKLDAAASGASTGKARAEWSDRIGAKVKTNIVKPPGLTGNPVIEFEIELIAGSTGATIIGEPKLIKGSGNANLDEAVKRAIVKSDPLPMPTKSEAFERKVRLLVKPLEE